MSEGDTQGIYITFAAHMAHRPHILVVDDDAAIRELVATYLTDNEFRVSGAAPVRR